MNRRNGCGADQRHLLREMLAVGIAGQAFAERGHDARAHLGGGGFGKGEHDELIDIAAVGLGGIAYKVGAALGQDGRFSGPGGGADDQALARRRDGLGLLGGECDLSHRPQMIPVCSHNHEWYGSARRGRVTEPCSGKMRAAQKTGGPQGHGAVLRPEFQGRTYRTLSLRVNETRGDAEAGRSEAAALSVNGFVRPWGWRIRCN